MKRIFSGLIAIFTAVTLCSCGPAGNVTPIVTDFTGKGVASIDRYETEFELKFLSGGIFELTVTSPETINGMKFCWNGDQFLMSYPGVEETSDTLPLKGSFADVIRRVLYDVKLKDAKAPANTLKLTGTVSEGKYEVNLRADGFVTGISVPSLKLEIKMTNFEYCFNK